MAEFQNEELIKQLKFKLNNNNIYFRVFKDIVFPDSSLDIKAGADLIVSGIGIMTNPDIYNFIVIYRDKIEEESKEDEGFGLVRSSIVTLIDKLIKKEIAAYYVDKREPDVEIENILKYMWFFVVYKSHKNYKILSRKYR